MDGVQQLAEIVLCRVVLEIKEVEMPWGIVNRAAGKRDVVLVKVVDGNGCCPAFRPLGKMGDNLLRGVRLGPLEKVGSGRAGHHAAAQNGAAHLQGCQQCLISQGHGYIPPVHVDDFMLPLRENFSCTGRMGNRAGRGRPGFHRRLGSSPGMAGVTNVQQITR